MKHLICIVALLLPTLTGAAQEAATDSTAKGKWEKDAVLSLGLNQVSLSNWAGGGADALSIGGEFRAKANYVAPRQTWANNFATGYGILREGDREHPFKKNNDYFIIQSAYDRKLNEHWKLSARLDFRTQLASGFKYEVDSLGIERPVEAISHFMAPGYLTIPAIAITYAEGTKLTATLSPLTGKFTFVADEELAAEGAFGVEPGKMTRTQLGSSFAFNYEDTPINNVKLKTSLLLFSSYEHPGAIDVNWEGYINLKVNKYITTNLSAQLIYDEDIIIDGEPYLVQWRSVLNVGVSINLLEIGVKP